MAKRRFSCGSCNMCCNLLGVPEIKKPSNVWCEHALRPHGGCNIYQSRPEACAAFECLWLQSQRRVDDNDVMPRWLRPDFSRVVLYPDLNGGKQISINVDPEHPNAWRGAEIADYIQTFISKGAEVEIIIGDRRFPIDVV